MLSPGRPVRFISAAVALTGAMLIVVPARPVGQSGPALFQDPPQGVFTPLEPSQAVVRSRVIAIDFTPLKATLPFDLGGTAQLQTLPITLFGDVAETAVVTSIERTSTGYVWTGDLLNVSGGRVTLAVTGDAMAGSISTTESTFRIRPVANGMHVIEEIDQSAFPPELPPPTPPAETLLDTKPFSPVTFADDGSTIDVLVVYTQSARAARGGTNAIQSLIDLGITETNQAYADSGAIQRLRLVHKEEVDYTEATGMGTDLSRVANTSDGILDAVPVLRNTYGADLVQLIVNNSSACGIAYLMTSESPSFSGAAYGVTHYSCISPNYSFGHEMAHNMGLHHDIWVTGAATGAFPYSRGYVNQAAFAAGAPTNKRWRDIMAYNDQCAGSGFNCTRIKYFSNPNNFNTGDTMGNAQSANGVLSLNNTRVTVSNFRQSIPVAPLAFNKSLPANGAGGQTLSPTVSWGASNGATSYEVCVDTTNDNACSGTWTNVGHTTSTSLGGLSPSSTYFWHVRANNSGGTTYSDGGTTAYWSFTTAAAPGAFAKTAPLQNATKASLTPNLTWTTSAGATAYAYCVDTTNNNACDTSWVSAGNNLSVTLPSLPPGTIHYWNVRAANGISTVYADGSVSAFRTFTTEALPFGQVDTPSQGAGGIQGAIAVTGWALDDIGVSTVQIFRNCLGFEPANCQTVLGQSLVFVGNAAFLPGARPDVEAAFPTLPQNNRAGWGYLMLTPMLPHVPNSLSYGGQGPLTIYAIATDANGNKKVLGRTSDPQSPGYNTPTAIEMSNETIAKPFGAIDTPQQGQTISGVFNNFGWALTPDTNTGSGDGDDIFIPADGSTMTVFVDGLPVALVSYNQCRGTVGNPVPPGLYCNDDVSSIFGNLSPQPQFTTRVNNPTRFRNLDAGRAAIGAYTFDSAALNDGRHTIAWSVTDSAGRTEGIGSRFFNVLNGAPAPSSVSSSASLLEPLAPVTEGVWGRSGFSLATPWTKLKPNWDRAYTMRLTEMGRLELWLGRVDAGYLVSNDALQPLPIGSTLLESSFAWTPPPGYVGTYELVFTRAGRRIHVRVTVVPRTR